MSSKTDLQDAETSTFGRIIFSQGFKESLGDHSKTSILEKCLPDPACLLLSLGLPLAGRNLKKTSKIIWGRGETRLLSASVEPELGIFRQKSG